METKGINELLGQLQAAQRLAASGTESAQATGEAPDFSALLKSALDQVNAAQQKGGELAKEFELGNPNVNLQDVMVNLQKANVSFQTMIQVRNKLVTAYQEIMNMPV
jgi:flagellar hook-basal body complex protein FliE